MAEQDAAERLARLEASLTEAAKDAGIAGAVAGVPFAPGAAEQFTRLVRGEVSCHEEGGRLIATGPGFQPIADFVRSKLTSPEFAHFVRSSTQQPSSTPSSAGSPPAAQPPPAALPPLANDGSIGDWALAHHHAKAAEAARGAGSNAAIDMSQPFGLRPRR
jgi:hypothetical protein